MQVRGTYNGEEIEATFEDGLESERSPIVGGADILTLKGDVELINLSILGKGYNPHAIEKEHVRRAKSEEGYKDSEVGKFIESLLGSIYELADEVEFDEEVERDWDD